MLTKYSLGKVDGKLALTFRLLAHKEKTTGPPHDLAALAQEIALEVESNPRAKRASEELLKFLAGLQTKQIVESTAKLSEFIDKEIILTDPAFLGHMTAFYQQVETEHKTITNKPWGPNSPT